MDTIDLNLFKIFYVVAVNKNFTKASEALYVSQPAITQSIKKLEEQLNVELFKRTNNGIELTNAGEVVYYYSEKLCNMISANSNLIAQISNIQFEVINIGVPTHLGSFYLTNYLLEFNQKYPQTHINIINKKSEEMLKMLEKRELDIVIDTDMLLIENQLIKKIDILKLEGCFVTGEKYRQLTSLKISPVTLAGYPLILPSKSTSNRKMLDLYFKEKNVILNPLIEANSSSISKSIILQGLGIGWMIRDFIKEDLEAGILYEIKVDINEVSIPMSIAYNNKYLNRAVKEFINLFTKENSSN